MYKIPLYIYTHQLFLGTENELNWIYSYVYLNYKPLYKCTTTFPKSPLRLSKLPSFKYATFSTCNNDDIVPKLRSFSRSCVAAILKLQVIEYAPNQVHLPSAYLSWHAMEILSMFHEAERLFVSSLHIHSGIGYFVTSLPALLVLSSGWPKESRCKSIMILLNSASGIVEFKKYETICLLFGIIVFLCPEYALCPYTNNTTKSLQSILNFYQRKRTM